jgi:hypothetical protein
MVFITIELPQENAGTAEDTYSVCRVPKRRLSVDKKERFPGPVFENLENVVQIE